MFKKRIFTLSTLAADGAALVKGMPESIMARRRRGITHAFAEKLRLAATAVNGCVYCTYGHTGLALKAGIAREEIDRLLSREIGSAVDAFEAPGLLFAQHYADNHGRPEPDMLAGLEAAYGPQLARDILVYVREIQFGNLSGNTFEAFLSRTQGDPAPGSNPVFEGLFFLLSLPVLGPLHLAMRIQGAARPDAPIGLKGSDVAPVGMVQYLMQWMYGVSEPWILRFTDFMLRTEGRKARLVKMKKPDAFPSGVILSTEAVCRFIDFIYALENTHGAVRMAVTDCVCQTTLNKTREPRKKDMALFYTAELYTTCRHTGIQNVFEPITTAEEAKRMVREFHRAGLLHNVLYCNGSGKWTFVLCNCDDQICVPYRAYMAGRKSEFGAGPEIIRYDAHKCMGIAECGRCLERCVLKACGDRDGKSAVALERCLGCGLCTSTCRGGARTLVPRADYRHEDILTTRILLGA